MASTILTGSSGVTTIDLFQCDTSQHKASWAFYQIRKIADCSWARNAGDVFPATDMKETAGKRSQHASWHVRNARAIKHVGIANPAAGKIFLAFQAHKQPTILRIWQEAHNLCVDWHHTVAVLANPVQSQLFFICVMRL